MSERLIVDWQGLRKMGWPYSRTQTWRMMAAGEFPQSFKLGKHHNSHPVWHVREVLAHLEALGPKVT